MLGLPSDLVHRPFYTRAHQRVSQALRRAISPSLDNVIFILESTRLPHGLDHIQHTLSLAVSEVECATVARLSAVPEDFCLFEGVQTQHVALGEVHDVQVVPYTSTVAIGSISLAVRVTVVRCTHCVG